MEDEKIKVRVTESDQVIEVLVLNKHADRIQVLLGAGADSVRCQLLPTPNGRAYAGSVMGREIVFFLCRRYGSEGSLIWRGSRFFALRVKAFKKSRSCHIIGI